jgi:hypothetical protein
VVGDHGQVAVALVVGDLIDAGLCPPLPGRVAVT